MPSAPLFSPEIFHRHDTTSNRDIEYSFQVILTGPFISSMPGGNLDIIG